MGIHQVPAEMTVPVYTGHDNSYANGVTKTFPYSFKVLDESHVLVMVDGQVQTLGVQYTVTGVNDASGGNVEFFVAPRSGAFVHRRRQMPISRETNYVNLGDLLASTLNSDQDAPVMMLQQLLSAINYSIRLPEDTFPVPDLSFPKPESSKLIGWNVAADALRNTDPTGPGDLLLRSDLADPTGGGRLVAFKRSTTGSTARATQAKLDEAPAAITDFGASTATTDNYAALNTALQNLGRGEVMTIPAGRFNVSSVPANTKGVRMKGPGQLVAPVPVSQINTYRYDHPVAINKEYLWRVFQVLNNTNREIRCYTFGDSTVEGGLNFIDWNYFLQVLLPDMASARGCRNYFKVTNRGVGGSSLATLNMTPDTGVNSATPGDLFILKCGINDAFPEATRLADFESRLRTQLAAVRATSGGDVGSLAILLVGPNPVWDMEYDARNTRWFEQLRPVFEAAARDYKCAYFDAYAYLQDASFAPGRWLDQSPAGTGLHPTNIGHSWIWGGVMDFIFGDSEMLRYKTNQFHNRGQFRGYPAAKNPPIWYPNTYPPGITMETALIADGFPIDGGLTTEAHADGFIMQTLHVNDSGGTVMTRTANAGDNVWGAWHGESYRFATSAAFLNNWTDFGGPYGGGRAIVSSQGYVSLDGMIKPGTTTPGTSMFGLPVHMRPGNQRVVAAVSEAGLCTLEIMPSGLVLLRSGTVAQWLSLSGVGFRR